MTKSDINSLLATFKKQGHVLSMTSWLFEPNVPEKTETRYLGVKLTAEWDDVLPKKSRLMLRVLYNHTDSRIQWQLANTLPFLELKTEQLFTDTSLKTKLNQLHLDLKKAKAEYQKHTDTIENVYRQIAAVRKNDLVAK